MMVVVDVVIVEVRAVGSKLLEEDDATAVAGEGPFNDCPIVVHMSSEEMI